MANQLKTNTSALESVLEQINALPEALNTSDATASTDDIVIGETAYVNGVKVIGANPYEKTTTDAEVNSQAITIEEISALLDGKSVPGDGNSDYNNVELSNFDAIGCKHVFYTTVEDGKIVTKISEGSDYTNHYGIQPCRGSIVVCGSCRTNAVGFNGCTCIAKESENYLAVLINDSTGWIHMDGDVGGGND